MSQGFSYRVETGSSYAGRTAGSPRHLAQELPDGAKILKNFMRYLRKKTAQAHPAYLEALDPAAELYDGKVRILDQRGGDLKLHDQPVRVLRHLAFQLQEIADELERRSYE